jgi:hypothetical protein
VLLDATVAHSLAVLGRADALAKAVGGLAHGVLSTDPHETSKLRGIRAALQREAESAQPGSGRQSKAISAVEMTAAISVTTLRPPRVDATHR